MRLADAVGNTPLVECPRLSPRPGVRLFAKLEGGNPSGSIKDRVARALLDAAERSGALQPGGEIVEASSGNTAIALGALARSRGYRCHVVLPHGCVPTIADALALLGVRVTVCESVAGMKGAIDVAEAYARATGAVPMRQFSSPDNERVHYEETAAEILARFTEGGPLGERLDVFVAGIGTGGTIMGVGRRLREVNPQVRVVGVEPRMGERLQGLKSVDDGFAPPLLDLDLLSRRMLVDAATSLRAAERLMAAEGIVAGVSAGATLHAALSEADRLSTGNIVFMCSDGGWKYLPTRPWDAAAADDARLDETHWW